MTWTRNNSKLACANLYAVVYAPGDSELTLDLLGKRSVALTKGDALQLADIISKAARGLKGSGHASRAATSSDPDHAGKHDNSRVAQPSSASRKPKPQK